MKNRLKVTDHAVLRYLERVQGIDIPKVRETIREMAQPYNDACVKQAEIGGWWFIFDNGALVTIQGSKSKIHGFHKNDRGPNRRSGGPDAGEWYE